MHLYRHWAQETELATALASSPTRHHDRGRARERARDRERELGRRVRGTSEDVRQDIGVLPFQRRGVQQANMMALPTASVSLGHAGAMSPLILSPRVWDVSRCVCVCVCVCVCGV